MKKVLALLLALVMIFALAACGESSQPAKTDTAAEAPQPEAPAQPEAEQPEAAEPVEEPKIDFPTKSIRVLCGFTPGGSNDLFTRAVVDAANAYLPNGQVMFVENVTGASGTIAATEVFNAEPDGYTLMGLGSGVVCAQPLLIDTEYNPDEFTFLCCVAKVPVGMMVPIDAPYETVDEWVAWCKDHPGEFAIALPGKGTPAHISAMAVAAAAGIEINYLFYNGASEAVPAMLGGFAQGFVSQEVDCIAQVESGAAKMIYTTGDKGYFGDAYDINKTDIKIEYYFMNLIMGPKDMPQEIVDILTNAIKTAYDNGDLVEPFGNLKMVPSWTNGEETAAEVLKDFETNREILKAAGIETLK